MFSRLPESNAPRQRRAGGLVVSTTMHVLLVALAVRATMLTAAPSPKPEVVPVLFTSQRVSTAREPVASPRTTRSSPTKSAPTLPVPALVISDIVPDALPATDAMIGLPNRDDFGPPTSVSGGDPSGSTPNVSDGAPLPERFVDNVIVAIPGTATPRYPSMLQSAGVEGDVRAQFVVDTLGRVEPGSVRVLDTTHDQFAAAVRTALARARFKPAEAGGHKVRQLAEQTFTFRLAARN